MDTVGSLLREICTVMFFILRDTSPLVRVLKSIKQYLPALPVRKVLTIRR